MAKQLTVKELIEKLHAIVKENPKVADAKVTTEGCDCTGDAVDVVVYGEDTGVEITR